MGEVNDTDLRHRRRTEYTAIETEDAFRQATLGTPCPMAWMCLVWCQAKLHAQAFERIGVTNALDGSEDQRVSREARIFWDDAHMKTERASAVVEVDEEVVAGRRRWTYGDVYRNICEHQKRGHVVSSTSPRRTHRREPRGRWRMGQRPVGPPRMGRQRVGRWSVGRVGRWPLAPSGMAAALPLRRQPGGASADAEPGAAHAAAAHPRLFQRTQPVEARRAKQAAHPRNDITNSSDGWRVHCEVCDGN